MLELNSTLPSLVTINYESFLPYDEITKRRNQNADNDDHLMFGQLMVLNTQDEFANRDKRQLIIDAGKSVELSICESDFNANGNLNCSRFGRKSATLPVRRKLMPTWKSTWRVSWWLSTLTWSVTITTTGAPFLHSTIHHGAFSWAITLISWRINLPTRRWAHCWASTVNLSRKIVSTLSSSWVPAKTCNNPCPCKVFRNFGQRPTLMRWMTLPATRYSGILIWIMSAILTFLSCFRSGILRLQRS